jgi:hypothetical protein
VYIQYRYCRYVEFSSHSVPTVRSATTVASLLQFQIFVLFIVKPMVAAILL